LPLLLEDFLSLYQRRQPTTNVGAKSFQKIYALDDRAKNEQRRYWTSRLPSIGTSFFFPALNTNLSSIPRRVVHTLNFPQDLKKLAKDWSVSLPAVILASWARAQAEYTQNSLVVFGIWCTGRSGPHQGLDRLAFPCVNVLPMSVELLGKETRSLASEVQKDLNARNYVIEQSDLEDIDRWVHGKGRPLCNTFINILRTGTAGYSGIPESMLEVVEMPHISLPDGRDAEPKVVGRSHLSRLIQVRHSPSLTRSSLTR
jgi:ferricrocin synthase